METTLNRRTWSQWLAILSLIFAWGWIVGIISTILTLWIVGLPVLLETPGERLRSVLGWLVLSAIATPVTGLCVWLVPPKETRIIKLIVLLGGMIPAAAVQLLIFYAIAQCAR